MKIVIDSDVLIEILKKNNEVIRRIEKIKDEELFISVITEGELLAGKECRKIEKIETVLKLLEQFKKVDLGNKLMRKAAEFSRKYSVKLADCIIAATSFFLDAKIFSLNIKDFSRIKEVELLE